MGTHFNYQHLRQIIEAHFDLQELRIFCFDLNILYDDLSGDRLSSKTVSLVDHMRKTGQMVRLMTALELARPAINWPTWEPVAEEINSEDSLPFVPSDANNPFGRTGKIQHLSDYLIRQPLTDAIMNELQKGVSLSIVGPSQTGKSSLLWYITQFGPDQIGLPAHDFVYLSMELIHSEEDFFDYICAELDIDPARGFRLARKLKGRKIILCLDEIEKMTWDGFSLNVRTELRGLADGAAAPFTLVIASRSSLGDLFPDSPEMTSPLAGLCMQVDMPFFSLAEAQALVTTYLQAGDVVLPPDEVEKAWQLTQGHPRNLQIALHNAFTQFLMTGGKDG